jgi:hypothetical protein
MTVPTNITRIDCIILYALPSFQFFRHAYVHWLVCWYKTFEKLLNNMTPSITTPMDPTIGTIFQSCPLSNSLEQQYLLETALYQARLKEDQFLRSDRDEERLVWMVRLAEGLGECRFGFDCYIRLFTHISNELIKMAGSVDRLTESIEASFHVAHLSARIYVQVVLIAALEEKQEYVYKLVEDIDGELNPLKGLLARSFAFQCLPQIFESPEKALDNAKKCCYLWTRWIRYGNCGDIEVREWEGEQLYFYVERALVYLLSLCRGDPEIFSIIIVGKLLQEYLVSVLHEELQSKVLISVLDNVPKAIISKYLEAMILVVVKFSPTANIIILMQRLINDAFCEGSAQLGVVWERVKEIINMRPELDINDALQLCSTIITFALKESNIEAMVEVLKFITTTLLVDIQLSISESASYAVASILESLAQSLKTEEEILEIVPWIVNVTKKVDVECVRGLGRKVLTSISSMTISDWTALCALLVITDEPTEEIVQEIVRHKVEDTLHYFKPYPKYNVAIIEYIVKKNIAIENVHILKDALKPANLEYFTLYLDLLPKFLGRDRYDLMVDVTTIKLTLGNYRNRARYNIAKYRDSFRSTQRAYRNRR